MDPTPKHPKRPRLNSWGPVGDTSPTAHHQQLLDSTAQFAPSGVPFSTHPHYSNPASMGVWDGKNIPQPGQHAISNSRSQSIVGPTITPPPAPGGPYPPHRTPSSASVHQLSHDSSPVEHPGYTAFPQASNNAIATVEVEGNHIAGTNGSPPGPPASRLQLKPLQTSQPGVFQDPHAQGFYTAQHHSTGAAGSADHRLSVSGAEMVSPEGQASLQGASPLVSTGGYPGLQAAAAQIASAAGGIGASPIVPSPGGGGGVMLAGGQGVNVVTTYPPRRKAIRAAQACDACRARKAKCDEGRPSCGFCKESQVPCVYREVPPPKQDRTLLQILDRLGRMETLLDNINSREQIQQKVANAEPTSKATSPNTRNSVSASGAGTGPTAVTPVQTIRPSNAQENLLDEDEQLTIPYQHTTAAHKLLWWPSIRALIDEDLLQQETYVIDEEENRGVLRIYGRGEGSGTGDTLFEEDSDIEYTSTGADQWGNIQYRDRGNHWDRALGEDGTVGDQAMSDQAHAPEDPRRGDLTNGNGPAEPGQLKLDRPTVLKLLNSYLANIHILHPILDSATITEAVLRFADRFNPSPVGSPDAATGPYSQPGLGMPMSEPRAEMPSPRHRANSIPGKRKRGMSTSEAPPVPHHMPAPGSHAMPPPPAASKPRTIPRTIHSALVLLVLALGAVCLHRQPIPGPVPRSSQYGSSSFDVGSTQYQTNSPPFSANSPPYAGLGRRGPRNMDVIPGLPYFARALEIVGGLAGSNELETIQAGLLIGLYWGQQARVLDSWKWISMSCTGCQVLIRMKLGAEKDPLRKDLILRAFWSCLQLESDVLAELDLPPSGISRLEDSMMLPYAQSKPSPYTEVKEDDPLMWMYYLAQIALRKLLNRVHTALYKQDKSHLDSPRSLAIARELDYQLEQWKKHLPEPLRWDESDPPSADINAARLRAKYFGARYIIHRPFVYHALHHVGDSFSTASPAVASEISQDQSPKGQTAPSAFSRRLSAANAGEERSDLPPTTLEASCRKCIESALQSTIAFHAFSPDTNRPVITNVFGTAHAQFGNLLVLQAAYQSLVLRSMIPGPHIITELLSKTIHWFQTLAPISPPLRRDMAILENAAAKLDIPMAMPQAQAPASQF